MQASAQILKDEQRSLGQPHGLTSDEATLRLAQFGPNDPTSKHSRPPRQARILSFSELDERQKYQFPPPPVIDVTDF